MRAAVYHRYGGPNVVHLEEVPAPTPKDDEVLVRIRATTVTSADWRIRSATVPPGFGPIIRLMYGITGPRQPILGAELAGEVEAVGTRVTKFGIGDKVFALCGVKLGGHAELRTMPEDGAIAHMPSNLTFQEAAALSFGGNAALFFLRDQAKVQRGERVLINGASGCVGAAAVQLARHFGAEVTAVCSGPNEGLVRSLGAAHVIDYTREDFTKSGETWDVILDTVGNCTFARCEAVLAPGGRMVLGSAGFGETLSAVLRPSRAGGRKVLGGVAPERGEDLRFLAELAETGAFKAVIDSEFPFDCIVDAHVRVDTHHKTGSVVVTV